MGIQRTAGGQLEKPKGPPRHEVEEPKGPAGHQLVVEQIPTDYWPDEEPEGTPDDDVILLDTVKDGIFACLLCLIFTTHCSSTQLRLQFAFDQ